MKKNEIVVGRHYQAKVSGKTVTVRVKAIRILAIPIPTYFEHGHPPTRDATVYDVINLATNRMLTFRSPVKFRQLVPTCDQCSKPFTRFRGDRPDTCLTCLEGLPRSSDAYLNEPEAEQRPDPTLATSTSTKTDSQTNSASKVVVTTPPVPNATASASTRLTDTEFPDGFNVGERVIFVGPEYGYGVETPTIGKRGTIFAREGHYSQRVGRAKEEMVTVQFALDRKPAVVNLSRLKLEDEKSPDPTTGNRLGTPVPVQNAAPSTPVLTSQCTCPDSPCPVHSGTYQFDRAKPFGKGGTTLCN